MLKEQVLSYLRKISYATLHHLPWQNKEYVVVTYAGTLLRCAKRNPAPSPSQYRRKWQALPGYHWASIQNKAKGLLKLQSAE